MTFAWQPVELTAGEIEDAAERATWGLFDLSLKSAGVERHLTRVEQVEGKTLANGVYGPMVVIAEWLARNWWHLARSRRSLPPDASRTEAYAWSRVRTLSYVGDGLPLPIVTFRPEDADYTRVTCVAEDAPAEFERVRFIESCDQVVETAALREAVRAFVESILDRLRATCPNEARLHDLESTWEIATDPGSAQHEAYVRACQAGERWGAVSPAAAIVLGGLPPRGVQPLLDAVLERIPIGGLADWFAWAARGWEAAGRRRKLDAQSPLAKLRAQVAELPAGTSTRPWRQGWSDAQRLRRALGADGGARPALPVIPGSADTQLGLRESVVAWRAGRQPLRVFGGQPTKFLAIRDLHGPLFGADVDSARLHSPRVSGSASIANAFAAEWLAPIERVRVALAGRSYLGLDDVMDIARSIDAPPSCIRHQIQNHGLAYIDPAA